MKSKTYEEFVEKFKPKKTTDDCYTPPEIYEVVKKWACEKYGISHRQVVRPFWPGGSYEDFEYPDDCVVVDNPPFSIFSKICEYYLEKGIRFFLFAPTLTFLGGKNTWNKMNHIFCDAKIVYENGATVSTSFATNCGNEDVVAQSSPELSRLINETMREFSKGRQLPRYDYPDHIMTGAMMQGMARKGIEFIIHQNDCQLIRSLDAQKKDGREILVAACSCPKKQ